MQICAALIDQQVVVCRLLDNAAVHQCAAAIQSGTAKEVRGPPTRRLEASSCSDALLALQVVPLYCFDPR